MLGPVRPVRNGRLDGLGELLFPGEMDNFWVIQKCIRCLPEHREYPDHVNPVQYGAQEGH